MDETKGKLVTLLSGMPREEAEEVLTQEKGKNVPAVIDRDPFPTKEEVERWNPKRLTPKHKQILSLYAQGMKRREIGAMCNCTPEFVTLLAGTEAGRAHLKELEEYMDGRMRNLYKKSIDAIEDQLETGKGADKIAAAKLQLQVTGKLGRTTEEKETAEDVIQRIFNMQVNGNIIINQGDRK